MSKCQMCGEKEASINEDVCLDCKEEWESTCFQIEKLQKDGHTFHCACRIITGDGECECNFTDYIPGPISKKMYFGRCAVCLKERNKHEDWCRNKPTNTHNNK